MDNVLYGKAMEHFRNRIDVKLVSNKERLFKMDIQTRLYVTQNNGNDLVAIHKNKVTLGFSKLA